LATANAFSIRSSIDNSVMYIIHYSNYLVNGLED